MLGVSRLEKPGKGRLKDSPTRGVLQVGAKINQGKNRSSESRGCRRKLTGFIQVYPDQLASNFRRERGIERGKKKGL